MGFKCMECDRPAKYSHHFIPKSRGGTREFPICEICHAKVHSTKPVDISTLTRDAMIKKKANGENCGSVPYGYFKKGKYNIEDPEEQKILKFANRAYEKGARLIDIQNKFAAKRYLTRAGKVFTPQQVKSMIRDYRPVYKKREAT